MEYWYVIIRNIFKNIETLLQLKSNNKVNRAAWKYFVEKQIQEQLLINNYSLKTYKVICDETNNTPKILENKSFVGRVYLSDGYNKKCYTYQKNFELHDRIVVMWNRFIREIRREEKYNYSRNKCPRRTRSRKIDVNYKNIF